MGLLKADPCPKLVRLGPVKIGVGLANRVLMARLLIASKRAVDCPGKEVVSEAL